MEPRANHAIVGAFTLGVIVLILAFVYWLTASGGGVEQANLRLVMRGNVTGLSTGNDVLFNGLRVGQVSELYIDPNDPGQVIAIATIDRAAPVKPDTEATIAYDIISSVSHVELTGGSPGAPDLLDAEEMPTLTADTTGLTEILAGAQSIVGEVDQAVARVNTLIDEAAPEIERSLVNIAGFTDALAANSGGVDTFLASVSDVAQTLSGLGGRLETTIAGIETLLAAIDTDQIGTMMVDAGTVVRNVAVASENVDDIVAEIGVAAAGLTEFATGINQSLAAVNGVIERADGIVAAVDPVEVQSMVDNIGGLAERASTLVAALDPEQVRAMVDDIATVADAAATDIDAILAETQAAIAQFSGFGEGLNATLANVDAVVGAVDPVAVEAIVADLTAFGGQLTEAGAGIDAMLERVDRTIADVEAIVAAVDPEEVRGVVEGVAGVVDRIDTATVDINGIVAEVRIAVAAIDGFATGATATLGNVDALIAAIEPERVATVVENVEALSAELRDTVRGIDAILADAGTAVADVGTFARTLAESSDDVDQIVLDARRVADSASSFMANIAAQEETINAFVADAAAIAEQLNGTVGRLDAIFGDVEGLLEGDDGRGLIEEIRTAVRSIGEIAAAFESRADGIAGGIETFSTRGLADITALVGDARLTIQRLDQVVTQLGQNPSQLLFGGGADVRDYNRR